MKNTALSRGTIFFLWALFLFCTAACFASVSGCITDTNGDPVSGALVVFTDESNPADEYSYYTDREGRYEINFETYAADDADAQSAPKGFALLQNFPNPFNPSTVIRYEVPYDCHVSMVVYDILGRKVAVLRDGRISAGVHEEVWNGRDDNGIVLGSGLYLYKIIAGGYTAHGKVMFLR